MMRVLLLVLLAFAAGFATQRPEIPIWPVSIATFFIGLYASRLDRRLNNEAPDA